MDPLLDVNDVARLLGVRPRRVYELAETRDQNVRLPAVRIGRTLRFRRADIERWTEERVR